MTRHVLLDNVTHKDLKIVTAYEKGRGYDISVARVFPVEFRQLQSEYPLLFIKNSNSGHFETVALLGFSNDENLYLDGDGWDASCIPLSIERQPLLIGYQDQDTDGVPTQVPVVHIDLDHPAVSETEGEPVFLPQGGERPWLERMTSILMMIHQGHEICQSFSQVLVGLELIESLALEIEFIDGSKQSLTGLYAVNEEKLHGLNADGLDVLHKKGHLQNIYMMLASLPNIESLIERKNQRLTS